MGKYSWEGRIDRHARPISRWASNYPLEIIDFGRRSERVFCLTIQDTGRGASVVNRLPEMAKHICDQVELDLNRVLWVEETADGEAGIQVASEPPYKTD